jgi:hypothetical protein
MSEWDPEAAGNAAQWLRLPQKTMLELRNQPFEGAKCVWVPYSDTGYTKGLVQGTGDKPGMTKVRRLVDNKEKDYKDENVSNFDSPLFFNSHSSG